MTSFNNLALMLDDALQRCNKTWPKNNRGNCNPGAMGDQAVSKCREPEKNATIPQRRLQKMKEQMGEGANAGRDGRQQRRSARAGTDGPQAALRQVAEKGQDLNADGSGDGHMSNRQKMEEIERDLVSKDVTLVTLERQELMVRLLKEKAE